MGLGKLEVCKIFLNLSDKIWHVYKSLDKELNIKLVLKY